MSVVIPLEGFRLDLTGWTLQNVNAGNTLELKTISDQGGTDMGTVTGTKPIEIHGVNCPVDASKEDEGVWLSAEAKTGEEIVMRKLTVVSSDIKTVVVANPGALLAPFAKATFTVRSRAGNAEGLPQEKEIQATVKYAAPEELAFTGARSEGCPDGTLKPQTTVTITGTALGEITENDILTLWYPTEDGEAPYPVTDRAIAADGHSLTCSFGELETPLVAGEGRITLEPPEGGEYLAWLDVNYVTE